MKENLRILIFDHNALHEQIAAEKQLANECEVVTVLDDSDNFIQCV